MGQLLLETIVFSGDIGSEFRQNAESTRRIVSAKDKSNVNDEPLMLHVRECYPHVGVVSPPVEVQERSPPEGSGCRRSICGPSAGAKPRRERSWARLLFCVYPCDC